MNNNVTILLAAMAGGILGLIFFGGLWWTVGKGVQSKNPALWFFASLLLRMSIALAGFYFVSGHHWERMVSCLVGFVVARLVVTWLTRASRSRQPFPAQEIRHAP